MERPGEEVKSADLGGRRVGSLRESLRPWRPVDDLKQSGIPPPPRHVRPGIRLRDSPPLDDSLAFRCRRFYWHSFHGTTLSKLDLL